jgi:two-component system response regulator ChvI
LADNKACLASRPGVVKSRNALMDAAYNDQVYVDDRTHR